MESLTDRTFADAFAPGSWALASNPIEKRSGGGVIAEARRRGEAWAGLRGHAVLVRGSLSPTWASTFFGLNRAGAIVVPVAIGATPRELAHIAGDTGAKFFANLDGGAVPEGLVAIDAARDLHGIAPGALSSDLAMIVYTSGTTAAPKGVPMSHGNLAAQTAVLREAWSIDARDTLLHVLPMHHVHGITVAFLTAFSAGASFVCQAKFEAREALAAMRFATVFMAVPTVWGRILEVVEAPGCDDPLKAALRALRLFTSGSAGLPASVAERIRAVAGAIPLERYGMTEIGMALSNPLPPSERRAGTVGVPLPSVEVRIVDEHGAEGDGPGELWVRGPSVFSGYFSRNTASTDAAPYLQQGWFQTGDVARREEGRIRLLGRASVDILKTGGEKVSAIEVEESLREHPGVREVAVVGIPDAEWGDRIVAFVVAPALTAEALRAFAKERLAPHKVPKDVRFLDALPRNAMGKVQKGELKRG